MFNKVSKTKVALIKSIIGLSLCTVLTISASTAFAWFSNNKQVTAKGMTIGVESDSGIGVKGSSVYKYYDEYKEVRKTDIDPDNPEVSDMEMYEYDTVFTYKNVNTPMIIKVSIDNTRKEAFQVEFTTKSIGTTDDFKISDILEIKVGVNTTLDGYTSDGNITNPEEDLYNQIRDFFQDPANSVTDTVVNNSYMAHTFFDSDNAKLNSIIFDVSEHSLGTDNKLIVYIYFDYKSELVDGLVSKAMDAGENIFDLENGNQINTIGDIKSLYFKRAK